MSIARFQALLAEISGLTGVVDLVADDDGYVALSFDGLVLHAQYEADQDFVALFSRLPDVEGDRAEQIYLMLLGANLFWQGTKGATFGVESASGAVFLMDRKALDLLRADAAVAWIEQFQEIASYWKGRIEIANRGGPIVDPSMPEEATMNRPSTADESGGRLGESFIRI